MKTTMLLALAAVQLGSAPLHAATSFNFDNGSDPLATTGDALPAGVSAVFAHYVDEDEFGDPLPKPHYAEDPDGSSYGPIVSSGRLDASLSPVLLLFYQPIDITGFSVMLDSDTFGFNATIEFFDSDENQIHSIAIDQSVPDFLAEASGPINGVSKILFSSGASYDNLTFTGVPEPSAALLAAAGCLILANRRHRR